MARLSERTAFTFKPFHLTLQSGDCVLYLLAKSGFSLWPQVLARNPNRQAPATPDNFCAKGFPTFSRVFLK